MQKLILLIFMAIPAYCLAQGPGNLEARAEKLFNNEEYKMASVLYDSLLLASPDNFGYLIKAGQSHMNTGYTSRALSLFRIANKLAPENPELIFLIASVFDIQDNTDSAIHYFKQYISLRPNDPHAYNRLAILYLDRTGYEDSAIAVSERGIQQDPSNPGSYYVNSMALLNAGREVDAIFSARSGLKKDSTYSLLYVPLGLGYFYRNDFKEANRNFETGMNYASDKSLFIDYAVQSRLLQNTNKEMMETLTNSEARFREFHSGNISSLLKETEKDESPWYYPDLLKKFNSNPLEFGLEDFFMLYLGFTKDKNYSPYLNNTERLDKLLEEENYGSYLNEGRNYMIENPADFPLYLNLAAVSEYLGISESQYKNLYCYYGFLKAITASGSGISIDQAFVVTYVSHEYTVVSQMGYEVKSQSLVEEKKQQYDRLKVVDSNDQEKEVYFNISIPRSWLAKKRLN
jgi:tetratricopeptide (TPR) repeat protein